MPTITIYTTRFCPYCINAKRLLDSKGVAYNEISVDLSPAKRREMTQLAGGKSSVPQIWIGEKYIGGCNELYALEQQQQLNPLLTANL